MALTYGDLRALIDAEKLGWQPRADLPDYVRLPLHSLGASSSLSVFSSTLSATLHCRANLIVFS